MRHLKTTLSVVCLLFLSLRATASPQVPHLLHYQSIVFNHDGTKLPDGFIDVEFSIVDPQGEVLYSEIQRNVQVIRGCIHVVIGEGLTPGTNTPTGGIPPSAFDPTSGDRRVLVKVGSNVESEDITLGMIPYSLYSEKAFAVIPNSIGSEEIRDGSIELKDLSKSLEFTDLKGIASEAQIPSSVTTDLELLSHQKAQEAHWAKQIRIEGPFIHVASTTVEDALKALDDRIFEALHNAREDTGKEAQRRTTSDTNLQASLSTETQNRTDAITATLNSEVSRAGDTVFGDLLFFTDNTLTNETLRLSPQTGDIISLGELSLLNGLISLKKDITTQEPLFLMKDSEGIERVRIDGETGKMTIDGNVVLTGTVDGVNVGGGPDSLDGRVTQEVTNRTNADNVLQSNLNTESTARTNADTTLQSNLDAEANTRGAADSALQTNLTQEVGDRQTADNAEALARSSADTTLQSNLDAEANARASAVSGLQTGLDKEIVDRTSADSTLQTNITAAQSTANTAVSNAATAQTTADTAVTNAAAAQSTANSAVTAAGAAQTTANTAVTNAAAAQTTANSAATAAGAAQSTANTGVTNAATAQTAATNAATAASSAQSTANTAVTNAATAQTTADSAATTASNAATAAAAAQTTANSASSAITNHGTRIEVLEGEKVSTSAGYLSDGETIPLLYDRYWPSQCVWTAAFASSPSGMSIDTYNTSVGANGIVTCTASGSHVVCGTHCSTVPITKPATCSYTIICIGREILRL